MERYSHLVLGGTFDHLHDGHRKLLAEAFSLSRHILLGLTVAEMNSKKAWKDSILPYEERKREIEAFAGSQKRLSDLTIIPIHNVFGTTLEDKNLEAILVTPHSIRGAEEINAERKKRQMKELPVHVCGLLSDDEGEVLSSTRIREGEVDRSGFVYAHLFKDTIVISDEVKEYVRQPLGESHITFPEDLAKTLVPLIFVGDVVTETALKSGLPVTSAWIDGRSHRDAYEFPIKPPYSLSDTGLVNDPGTIQKDVAAFMVNRLISENVVFKVGGEEDLLTLVAILIAPLGSKVIYGNPFGEKGITVVTVTEEKKAEIRGLIEHL